MKPEYEYRCMSEYKYGKPCGKLIFKYNGNIDKIGIDMFTKCPRCKSEIVIKGGKINE